MVTRRLRSEYMKKFKDPKWETYNKCYEDTLKYRLTRRLLEQTHNPWFWRGSDTDSDSGGRSPLSLSKVRPEAHTEACGDRLGPDPMVPRLPLQDELEEVQMSAPHLVINGETGARGTQAQEERVCNGGKQLTMTKNQKEKEAGQTKQTQPSKFSKRSWRGRRTQAWQVERHITFALQLQPARSTNLLFVPRPDGKWNVRSKFRGRSAGEPNLLIWSKQERVEDCNTEVRFTPTGKICTNYGRFGQKHQQKDTLGLFQVCCFSHLY
ncbi:centriole, cilia and spindle-associated protein isoform X3 [Takifugu rubripes]|uniref:centriole, cilia and spindle-associated protein isoform X3 n=1 Tax=Takifugu rubripes TaxID=31033 RepID=UPI0005D1BE40|nr:centriole, cilia and spindle-associated protein-like isoform X3 [Takifugu rubripes]|eukprot:XP_011607910.1 PREDICTED: centriole, cilia and spindle-associated protein-like isoform X3 [Takifugu rubripes]